MQSSSELRRTTTNTNTTEDTRTKTKLNPKNSDNDRIISNKTLGIIAAISVLIGACIVKQPIRFFEELSSTAKIGIGGASIVAGAAALVKLIQRALGSHSSKKAHCKKELSSNERPTLNRFIKSDSAYGLLGRTTPSKPSQTQTPEIAEPASLGLEDKNEAKPSSSSSSSQEEQITRTDDTNGTSLDTDPEPNGTPKQTQEELAGSEHSTSINLGAEPDIK